MLPVAEREAPLGGLLAGVVCAPCPELSLELEDFIGDALLLVVGQKDGPVQQFWVLLKHPGAKTIPEDHRHRHLCFTQVLPDKHGATTTLVALDDQGWARTRKRRLGGQVAVVGVLQKVQDLAPIKVDEADVEHGRADPLLGPRGLGPPRRQNGPVRVEPQEFRWRHP